jgi:hypothetical protein
MPEPDVPELHTNLPRPWEEHASFNDLLLEQFRKAPWFLLSLAAHGILIGIIMIFPWSLVQSEKKAEVTAKMELPPQEVFEEPEEKPPEVEEEPVEEEPVLQDAEIEEVETVPEEGDPLESDSPFQGDGLNDLIGLGGGAGGKYGGRFGGRRRGGSATEQSLLAALMWLKDHQDGDGRWDSDGFSKNCKSNICDGPGEALHDVGVTGLALLAFLGNGDTTRSGQYKDQVVRAVRWLVDQQDPDSGLIGEKSGNSYLYSHSIATLALCEAYNFGRSPQLRGPAQRAVYYIQKARNPYKAWRYYEPPDGDNDTSVTGWMVFALKAAEDAGLDIDKTCYDGALAWFDEVTDPATGRTGYQQRGEPSSRRTGFESRFPVDKTESLTAVSLLCRIFIGQTPEKNAIMRTQADRLRRMPPAWEVTPERSLVDEYYWYYGAFAMFQMGGEDWRIWRQALEKAILDNQRKDGDEKGSWDPVGAWGRDGGRVYMTAIGALCLEVYFRYSRVLGAR